MKTLLSRAFSVIVCLVAAIAVRWVSLTLPFGLNAVTATLFALCFFAFCFHFRAHTVPLIFSIEAGTAVSWVSIYAFFFAAWTFHSVPVARVCAAAGTFLLLPARWFFESIGGDQTTVFFDPTSFAGTNGLILGLILYFLFRAIMDRRSNGKNVAQTAAERQEAKVG